VPLITSPADQSIVTITLGRPDPRRRLMFPASIGMQ
jgi:hypothetical protein